MGQARQKEGGKKVIKWKCTICARQMQTDVKPGLVLRLCPDCKVTHCQRVVDIYSAAGEKEKLKDAKARLRDAVKARKNSRAVKEGIK